VHNLKHFVEVLNVFGNKNGLIVGVLDELSCKLAVCNIASVYSAIAGNKSWRRSHIDTTL
jgi:hypothetical protein